VSFGLLVRYRFLIRDGDVSCPDKSVFHFTGSNAAKAVSLHPVAQIREKSAPAAIATTTR